MMRTVGKIKRPITELLQMKIPGLHFCSIQQLSTIRRGDRTFKYSTKEEEEWWRVLMAMHVLAGEAAGDCVGG